MLTIFISAPFFLPRIALARLHGFTPIHLRLPMHAHHPLHPRSADYGPWNHREDPRILDKDRALKLRSFEP